MKKGVVETAPFSYQREESIKKRLFFVLLISIFMFGCNNNKIEDKTMGVNTIIFDFDGTLADTLPLCVTCVNSLSQEYGYKPLENVELLRNKTISDFIQEDLCLSWYQLPGYISKLKKMISEQSDSISLFETINELITELSKHCRIGIITSNLECTVKNVLERFSIKNISFIFSSEDHSTIKKIIYGKSSVIKSFLDKNNLNKNQVLYVGDELRDIQACRKAGVKIAAVTWGYNSREILDEEKTDYLIDKPLNLLNIICDF